MYASSWFLTLYTTALNLNLICCRIMDVFLSEGMEMIFKIALALLTIGKETILSLDMEAMLKVSCRFYHTRQFRERLSTTDNDNAIAVSSFSRKSCREKWRATSKAFSNLLTPSKSTRRRWRRWRKTTRSWERRSRKRWSSWGWEKWNKTTNTPIVIKLWLSLFALSQRLRNENRLLKKRNELLEAESTELANRLVRGQVSRAEEEETKYEPPTMLIECGVITNWTLFIRF